MSLDQHVRVDEISHKFEMGSCQIKTRSLGQILGKNCVYTLEAIFSVRYHIYLSEWFPWCNLGRVLMWVMLGQKLGH